MKGRVRMNGGMPRASLYDGGAVAMFFYSLFYGAAAALGGGGTYNIRKST